MFLNNKYTHWYEAIIKNCCSRHEGNFPDGYYEEHHIVPKSLGGSNERKNIIKLTAREHFLCHKLLVKMTTGQEKRSMSFALHKMAYGTNSTKYNLSFREYSYVRFVNAEAARERQITRFLDPKAHQKQVEYALNASMIAAEKNRCNNAFRSACSRRTQRLIADGTHNFLGGDVQRILWKDPSIREKRMQAIQRMIESKAHTFQQQDFIEQNRLKVKAHWANMMPDEKKERCQKISESNKGKKAWNKGKKMPLRPPVSNETRKKLSINAKKRSRTGNGKFINVSMK